MSYMEKKTTKRQTTIITLSDHNKEEIRNIQLQREVMEEEFNDKENGRSGLREHVTFHSGKKKSYVLLNFCKRRNKFCSPCYIMFYVLLLKIYS